MKQKDSKRKWKHGTVQTRRRVLLQAPYLLSGVIGKESDSGQIELIQGHVLGRGYFMNWMDGQKGWTVEDAGDDSTRPDWI